MRITHQLMINNSITAMEDNLERLNMLQDRIATGKQFQTMSDDPARAATALSLRSSLQTNQNFLDTDAVVNDWLTANEAGFTDMLNVAGRAQSLTIKGASDSNSAEERAVMAHEIDLLIDEAVANANLQHNGKYIFAGFKTKSTTPPFVLDAARAAVVTNDDTHSIQVDISPGQTLTTNFIGRAVFEPLFKALIGARDALLTNNSTNIANAMTALQTAQDPITTATTTNGVRQRQLNLTLDTMEKANVEIKSLLSAKEDVNMAEAISQLRGQETTYQSVIQVSQRTLSTLNLFDVMR